MSTTATHRRHCRPGWDARCSVNDNDEGSSSEFDRPALKAWSMKVD